LYSPPSHHATFSVILNLFLCALLLARSGDVHPNPGPSKNLFVGSYNVRGSSDKLKTKRLLNYASNKCSHDRMLYSFFESHITDKRRTEIEFGWRVGFVLSPGQTNARDVLTLYKDSLFDSILYKFADPKGRSTWLAGTYDNKNNLFVSIYAPNNGLNKEFYQSLFYEISKIKDTYNIDNTYILGDFNIDLTSKSNSKIKCFVSHQLLLNGLVTMCHGNSFSTIDYICVDKHPSSYTKQFNVVWGVDKSDHAALEAVFDLNITKGPGLRRSDTNFLDTPELSDNFNRDLVGLCSQINDFWDPHFKLEFLKMCI